LRGQCRLAMIAAAELKALRRGVERRTQHLSQACVRDNETVAMNIRVESRGAATLFVRQQQCQLGTRTVGYIQPKPAQLAAMVRGGIRTGCQQPATAIDQRLVPTARRGSSTGVGLSARCSSVL
jgi:hypothetical protein